MKYRLGGGGREVQTKAPSVRAKYEYFLEEHNP